MSAIVLGPYCVLLAVCDELTSDSGQDCVWEDVSQARTEI